MESIEHLKHKLLVAMPTLNDTYFERSVVYVLDHNAEGAMGLVINAPSSISYKDMFHYMDLTFSSKDADERQVLRGGPVDSERCFVFEAKHSPEAKDGVEVQIADTEDALKRLADQEHLDGSLVILGYAGWTAGQLENELARSDWMIVPATRRVLFDVPYSDRWSEAAREIGVDVSHLSGEVGHG